MANIHPTAIIDKKSNIDNDVNIGPYVIIGSNVNIGKGTSIGSSSVIEGNTTIGKNNKIFQFVSLGAIPQDKKYNGEDTKLIIGDNNTIREFCTFNIGTVTGIGETRIGDNNWIMAYVHIAHDCIVGNNTIFANNASLAGHVIIRDWVILGGFTLVYQSCIVGEHSMTAFATGVNKDIPPYVMASGFRARPCGLNIEGLRRRGFATDQLKSIKDVYNILYRSNLSYSDAKSQVITKSKDIKELKLFEQFFSSSTRGIIR